MDRLNLTERGIGLATLWSSLELVLLQDLRRLVIRWSSNGSDSYRVKFIKESVPEYMKRKETSVNLSKLLKETSESTWQCVIGDGSSSSKKLEDSLVCLIQRKNYDFLKKRLMKHMVNTKMLFKRQQALKDRWETLRMR